MSWLNLNQSFSSLKGQITNFASEVLSEVPVNDEAEGPSRTDSNVTELEDKCHKQELEIASLQKLTDELRASLQSERLNRKNGVREDETSWYWDPPPQAPAINQDLEDQYKVQIRALQDEISSLKERATIDLRPDAEEELNRLREENQNLTVNLEDLDTQHQQAMERLLSLKKELQKNFEVLKEEHEDLKNANDEYAVEIKSLLAKVGERDKEIEELKSKNADYETVYHKYQNLERIHGLLRENAEKFQEENQELHEEVFKLQEQVTKYEHDLEIAVKKSHLTNTVPKEKYDELLKEINDLRDRRNTNQVHLDEINIDDNAKSVIENLKRDIHDLKHKLSQKESDSQANTDHKIIKAEKIMQLYNKYVNFELPIDYVGEIPSPGVNIVLYKLESVFKTVNSFKKEIDNLEHKLSEKNLNLNHLQTQIDDLTTENDFLTTDIQHFESELNEMKKNNDFLISEIATLKNTSKLEPIIETHEDNLAKLETELADCNKLNKDFESEIKRIEKELTEVKKEKIILQESLSDLKTKYTNMLNELELFKNQTKAVEELENTASTQYTEKIKKITDEVDDLKKRLNASNAKNEQLSIDIHIIENDKVLLIKQVDDLKRNIEEKSLAFKELENDKISLDHKLKDYEKRLEEINNHKAEIEKENFAWQKQVSDLQTELSRDNTNTSEKNEKLAVEKVNHELSKKLESLIKKNVTLIETNDQLNNIINNMKVDQEKIVTENNALKNNIKTQEDAAPLQAIIDELKAKIIQQDVLSKEISALKEQNHKLIERELQLKTELSSTDSKIVHLEEEFEKLVADTHEKDSLIDSLDSSVQQNNTTITNLTQNIKDLEHTVNIKNDEIKNVTKSLEETLDKLNDSNVKLNAIQFERKRLLYELEEMGKEIIYIRNQEETRNNQLSSLTSKNEELQIAINNYQAIIDSKDKEIKELNQSIVELTDKIKTTDNIRHHNDEYAKLFEEKTTIENEVTELKNNLTVKAAELADLQLKYDQIQNTVAEYTTAIDKSTAEKTELINLINLKHNESMQYHNEIQRLNHVILEQSNEFKRIIEERERSMHNASQSCSGCESLRTTLKEKDEIIVALNQNMSEYERVKIELANASEVVRNMTDKYDNLDKSLAIQLETVKKLTAENTQLSEQEQNSTRELERLRRHLVETEENYTQELMSSEQKLTDCQTRLHQVEERAKQTSTVYTSNSIRANQEVETLRNQIKLLERQREEVQSRLSEADDARIRSEAALTNLQVVLEQFQLEKERDIHAATEKIRNKMEDQRRQNSKLQEEISRLNAKLEEASAGLQAAARLGDQVETKTAQINDLKDQVRTLQQSVAAAEERYYNAISNQQDKVDKNLVKNLVINYVMTSAQNAMNKTQVLRILSTVLDFNKQECEKLGLSKSNTSGDSLAAEFVKFLQNESRPRAPLPNMMGITQTASRSTTPTSRKSSTVGPHPVFEPGHRRNPSTGSNNLLFQNMESVDTASQLSRESDREPRVMSPMETGINQIRNTEGAILKSVLRDM